VHLINKKVREEERGLKKKEKKNLKRKMFSCDAHIGRILSLVWNSSDQDKTLITGSSDGLVRRYNVSSGKSLLEKSICRLLYRYPVRSIDD
jgi:WD40 repeat protein